MQKTENARSSGVRIGLPEMLRGRLGILRIAATAVAVLFVVLSVFAFLSAAREGRILFSRIVTVIGGVLMIAVAVELLLIVYTLGGGKPNFFLYDAEKRKRLPTSALTPELVSRRMDAYIARIARSKGQLWLPGYLETCDFGAKGEFRPITAYKMLLDLAETNTDGAWRCFCASSPDTVRWIVESLRAYEPRMMQDVLRIKLQSGADPTRIRECLLRNAGYLRRRMVAYVADHLRDFDGGR